MRIIPIEIAKSGSFLAKTIFDNDGRILLRKGFKLKDNIIIKLKKNGISQIYIKDQYSNIEIDDTIKPALRQKSVTLLKNVFENIHLIDENTTKEKYLKSINSISEDILNDILSNDNILISLIDIKTMDNYTYQHSINVAVMSVIIGVQLGLSTSNLLDLCMGAILHDIGKVFIPNRIIKKPSSLTCTEFNTIKTHCQKGYDYLDKNNIISRKSKEIVLFHHEKFNGTGYPQGLYTTNIPLLARIVAVADVYDALTSDRPYRKPLNPHEALEYILANVTTLFDIEIVTAFSKVIVPYPKGTLVKLSTGDVGVIESTFKDYPLRPIVKILESKNKSRENTTINLITELSIVITGIKYYL